MGKTIFNAYRDAYSGLSREVWLLSFALLINRCGSMVLAFLTLYLTEKLNFTVIQAGAIFSVYGLGSIAGGYLSGRLIKTVGAVRIQIVALAISCPLFCIVPIFESWLGVAISMFWVSVFSEGVRPANNVAIVQFADPELRTRAFGLQRMALNLGLSIGPAVGGILTIYNFDLLFYVDGLTTLLAAGLLLALFGFKKYSKRSESSDQQEQTLAGKGSPLADRPFLIFLFLLFCASVVFFQFHATYPKYLKDHYSMTKPMIGFLFAVNTLIIVVVEMILLDKVRQFNLLRTIGWGCFLACLGFAILPLSQAIWFTVFSMAIITLGEMLMFPLATSYVATRSTGRDVGMYMSWYSIMYSVTAVVSPLLGTAIYQWDKHAFWHASGIFGVVILIAFYRFRDNDIALEKE